MLKLPTKLVRRSLVAALLPLAAIACSERADNNKPPKARSEARQVGSRHFDLRWTVTADDVPEHASQAVVWIPLPQVLPEQDVDRIEVHTEYPHTYVEDKDFGNRMVRVTVAEPPRSFSISLTAAVDRRAITGPRPARLSDAERALYLRQEALVSLSPRIRAISDTLGPDHRRRYDYVLASMDYDKTVPGWGRGDSERACNIGKGNCTDFHSLFMSLSRTQNVPAVFEMGYPTQSGGETERLGGYHCWAWFHDGAHWVPVDISEADKAPVKADFFYGQLDADRITFSRGRGVILPGMQGEPLNYLPPGAYVEVDGKPLASVNRRLSYTVR